MRHHRAHIVLVHQVENNQRARIVPNDAPRGFQCAKVHFSSDRIEAFSFPLRMRRKRGDQDVFRRDTAHAPARLRLI